MSESEEKILEGLEEQVDLEVEELFEKNEEIPSYQFVGIAESAADIPLEQWGPLLTQNPRFLTVTYAVVHGYASHTPITARDVLSAVLVDYLGDYAQTSYNALLDAKRLMAEEGVTNANANQ